VQVGVKVDDIYWLDKNQIELKMMVPDFFRIVPLLRKYRVRFRILEKKGVPFFLQKLRKRKMLYFGSIFFVLCLFALSSFIWQIDIEGTNEIPIPQVQMILKEEGIYLGQIKYRLPSYKRLQERLRERIPQAAWVGFRLEGTRAIVTIVTKKKVERNHEDVKSTGPVDLVANKHAMIVDMRVERGKPMVEIHDIVKKGQLLVSGKYGDPEQPETEKFIGAKGKVIGEVWYHSEVSLPLLEQKKEYTGLRDQVTHFFVGTKTLRNPFQRAPRFHQYETIETIRSFFLGGIKLPFGLVDEERLEMRFIKHRRSLAEAVELAKQRAREELRLKLGLDGRILEEKVLHQRVDNGKVYLKMHFDVLENIAVSQPILQGE
jgi:similar to stage IV sporulation protein